jgi:serine/threonine protein kinase/Flp pilus assembly protein TadD
MPEPHQPEKSIFLAAIEISSAAERAAFLDQACVGNQSLRGEVEALLHAHEQPQPLVDTPLPGLIATVDEPISESHATVIGPYKLLQEIGEGGMGTVYMAEQTQPVQRKVALKIIKPGMDSRQVIARFEAERQALALMDHPNIAKVLDAGTTESRRPYFVMELVKGVPITRYCDEHRLPPRQRLELFLPVCHAVQHAHQKGIIHRDLKPSNVLVAEYDDKPVAKVIDFGVAKATGPKLTERTMYTEFGQVIGTLEYMSPEQAKLNALDIDTRSDIYALGVLLYELLTGTTPFEKKRLHQAAFDEMLRIIREEEPPKPSTRLSTTEALPSIAANRGLEPKKLSGLVRGELDWIVMKALEKDRNRRYETANGFAADVGRYLNDEAVQAGPPSTLYRFRKLARRYRTALATASSIVLVLVAGVVVSTWQAIRAGQALSEAEVRRVEAEANSRKLRQAVNDQFTLVSESKLFEAPGFQSLRKDLLESALKYYQDLLGQRPDDPDMQVEVAAAWLRLYQIYPMMHGYVNEDALHALAQGLEVVEALVREHPNDSGLYKKLAGFTKGTRLLHGLLRNPGQGDPDLKFRLAKRAVAIWEKFARDYPTEPAFQVDLSGFYLLTSGVRDQARQAAEALVSLRQAHVLREKLARDYPSVPEYQAALAETHNFLAERFGQDGPRQDVEDHYRQSLELRKKLVKECPGVTEYRAMLAESTSLLGDCLSENGKVRAAETHYREAIELYGKLVTDFPNMPFYRSQLAFSYDCLGHLFRDSGQSREAMQNYRQALENWQKLAADSPTLVSYQVSRMGSAFNLGPLLAASGQKQEADQIYRQAAQITAEGPDGLNARAAFLILCPDVRFRNPTQTVELARKAVKLDREDSNFWNTLGIAHYQAGNWKEAVAALQESVDILQREQFANTAGDFPLPSDCFFLAMAHWQLREKELARQWYGRGIRWVANNSSLSKLPRLFRDDFRRELRDDQVQAAELLGIKDEPKAKSTVPRK